MSENTTLREILKHTFKKIFASRKGLSWLASYIMQIFLTIVLVMTYNPFISEVDKAGYIFYLILANMLIELITLGLIVFEKIKITIGK
jgi:hypothetical protein